MTKHERIILDKLTENPMLSQSELADMLNITRSSVSVYISHLMQDGYIRGRGYVLEDQKSIVVIGTSSIDYSTSVDDTVFRDPSSSVIVDDQDLITSYGGIGKNIAEIIYRLGHNTSIISAVGSDALGKELMDECKRNGLNIDDVLVVPSSRSSTYLEVRSSVTNCALLRSANTVLQTRITPDYLESKHYKLRHAKAIVTEDGMSTNVLQSVSSRYPATFLVCSKAIYSRVSRYRHFLNQFNGLLADLDTAWMILGERGEAPTDDSSVYSLSFRLRKMTGGPILLCYGTNQFSYVDNDSCILCSYSAPSGLPGVFSAFAHYRDTVAAGMIHCLIDGADGETLLKYVSACREIAVQDNSFVNQRICQELISQTLSTKTFHFRSRHLH